MENRLFSVPLGMCCRNSIPMEGVEAQINPNSLVQFESFDVNNQNQTLERCNLLHALQGAPAVNDLHSSARVTNPHLCALVAKNISRNPEFEERFMRGLPFSGELTTLVASTNNLQTNVANYPLEAAYVSNNFANGLSSSVNGFLPCVAIPDPYGSCSLSNELSLSLATSQPSAINVSDQCSEASSKVLSLSCTSYRNGTFSHVLSGSRYLQVVQEILTAIASYSLEIFDQTSFWNGGIKMGESNDVNVFKDHMDPALRKRALEGKKAQLLTLLQVVDDRYSHCLDEIHMVISAFHAATELDPQLHARFALQTISFLYKSLRERISNQILALGERTEGGWQCSEKQWSLQQLKRKEHQLWKPQRGLPERSVSVLRAWMFQNFLHPYPKDAEKHLLALKSGLTRSQVSNWFINARVRLWKPMIEEMYAEMNKRKGRQNEAGSSNIHRNDFSFGNLRFNMY